jgi:integrase/recombinase XerD
MATCLFRSPLAHRLQAYLETRPSCTRGGTRHYLIGLLDLFFLNELKPGQPVTREVVARWVESNKHLAPGTRANRIGVMRQFCLYLSHFDPRTCIVCQDYLPHLRRPAFYIYSIKEVRAIMVAARKLGPPVGLRPLMVSTLIGLLYATGLRIGETLDLTLGDIDLRRRVIEVRKGKFGKSRYVPISHSTAHHLGAYLRRRRKAGFSTTATAPLFPNRIGARRRRPGFEAIFLQIQRQLGLRGPKGERGPRIHDLRHTFAVTRLLAWYRGGSHLGAKLPLLSTYLGHRMLTGTEVYLHATAPLLESAGRRFHAYFAAPPAARRPHSQ